MLAREVQLEFLEHKDIGQSQEIGYPSSGISVNPIVKILRSEYLEENLAGVLEQKVDKLKKVDFHQVDLV